MLESKTQHTKQLQVDRFRLKMEVEENKSQVSEPDSSESTHRINGTGIFTDRKLIRMVNDKCEYISIPVPWILWVLLFLNTAIDYLLGGFNRQIVFQLLV